MDWEESVHIDWHCVNRGWAYAVAILVPIIGVLGCIVGSFLGIFCYCKIKNKAFRESIGHRWKSIICRALCYIPNKARLTRRPENSTTNYGATSTVAYSSKQVILSTIMPQFT